MKTIKIITFLALLTGLTSLSFAGAGPDYWIRMNQAAKDKAALAAKATVPTKAAVTVKAQPAGEVASCATCSCCAKKA